MERAFQRRRHCRRRYGADRFYVGLDGPAKGDYAFPSRYPRGLRLFSEINSPHDPERHLYRDAPAGLYLRAWRAADLLDARGGRNGPAGKIDARESALRHWRLPRDHRLVQPALLPPD